MKIRSKKIEFGDKILATISHNGKVVARLTLDNIHTLRELMLHIRQSISTKDIRLSELFIRNYTQGWSITQPLLIA